MATNNKNTKDHGGEVNEVNLDCFIYPGGNGTYPVDAEQDLLDIDLFEYMESKRDKTNEDFNKLLDLLKKLWGNKLLLESKIANTERHVINLQQQVMDGKTFALELARFGREKNGQDKLIKAIDAFTEEAKIVSCVFSLDGRAVEFSKQQLRQLSQYYMRKEQILFSEGDDLLGYDTSGAGNDNEGKKHMFTFGEIVRYTKTYNGEQNKVAMDVLVVSEGDTFVDVLDFGQLKYSTYIIPRKIWKREVDHLENKAYMMDINSLMEEIGTFTFGNDINPNHNPSTHNINEYEKSGEEVVEQIGHNFANS